MQKEPELLENEYDIEVPQEKKKKMSFSKRMLSLFLLAAMLTAAASLVVYRDLLNIDTISRAITYRSLSRSDAGATEFFSYGADSTNHFAPFEGGLLVASGSGFRLYGQSGAEHVGESLYLAQPVIDVSDEVAVVYDGGGQALRALNKRGVVFSLDLEEGRGIFSARVSKKGYLAVTAQASRYKSVVTVYNDDFRKAFELNFSSGFVADAVVSADASQLAAVTLGQTDAGSDSKLVVYRLDSKEEQASALLGSLLPLDMRFDSSGIHIVGDSRYVLFSSSGESLASYFYGGRYLRDFSMDGDGYTALLLSEYRAGRVSDLVLFSKSGELIDTLSLGEEVLYLSAAGKYIALLYADRVDVYTSDLKLYASMSGTENARSALMRADGSVLLAGAEQARLYIP